MNRLEKKCFIASAGTHALLLILVFAAPAMMFSKKVESNIPVLRFLPTLTTDKMAIGGGEPTATRPPAPATVTPQPQPVQQVEPPPVVPVTQQKVEPIPEPKSEPSKPSKKIKWEPEKVPSKPIVKNGTEPAKSKKKETPKAEENEIAAEKADTFKPSFTPSSRNQTLNTKNAEAKARAEAANRAAGAQRAFAAKVQESLKTLGSSFAPGTSIDVPGTGGALFANYKLIVEAMYHQAWITPQDVSEESAVTRVRVVIRRDGIVIEARIIKPSGIRAMDKSVERALELKEIGQPFPEDSKDSERLFYINFDLKTKRLLG